MTKGDNATKKTGHGTLDTRKWTLETRKKIGQRGDSSSSTLVKNTLVKMGKKGNSGSCTLVRDWTKRRHDS